MKKTDTKGFARFIAFSFLGCVVFLSAGTTTEAAERSHLVGDGIVVGTNGPSGMSNLTSPVIDSDSAGNVLALWNHGGGYGNLPFSSLQSNASTGLGAMWPEGEAQVAGTYSYFPHKSLCSDDNGNIYLVFTQNTLSLRIYISRSQDRGQTWTTPTQIVGTFYPVPDNEETPRVSCDNNGHVYVLYKTNSDEWYLRYSTDHAVSWSDHVLVGDGDTLKDPAISCDDHGHAFIAYLSGQEGYDGQGSRVEVKTVSIGTMIEDAEDGDTEGWYVYDNTPNGASVSNVYDTEKDSNVIQLNAPGNHRNGFYHYRNTLDRENTTLQWDMKNYTGSGRFTVYTIVRLKNRRYAYLVYKNYGRDSVSRWGRWYIIYKRVDADMTDGSWHAFRRNLQEDVRSVKSRYSELENAEIDYILNVIYLRGSYQIDDIMFTP